MKNQNRLTEEQQRFLRACRDDAQTLEQLTDRMKVKPWLLSKWLRRSFFRSALASVLMEMRRRRELEFELAARQATNVLSRIIAGGEGTHVERQGSFDVLDLYFSRPRPGRKVMMPKPKAEKTLRLLIHPSVSEAEAASLLAGMNEDDSQGKADTASKETATHS